MSYKPRFSSKTTREGRRMHNRLNLARWVIYVGVPIAVSVVFAYPSSREHLVRWFPLLPTSEVETQVMQTNQIMKQWSNMELPDDDD